MKGQKSEMASVDRHKPKTKYLRADNGKGSGRRKGDDAEAYKDNFDKIKWGVRNEQT